MKCAQSRMWSGRSCGRPASSLARHREPPSLIACANWPAPTPSWWRWSSRFLRSSATMLKEFARLTKQVLDIVRKEESVRRLMSAPGVGPITALSLPRHDRPAGAVRLLAGGGAASGADAGALPVRRDRHPGQGQPMRRRTHPHRTLRGRSFPARALEEMVEPQGVGHEHRQTPRHGASPRSGGPQAGRHPAPHVGRRNRIPLWKGSRRPRIRMK